MPNLTVSIPANVVNDLDAAAIEFLDSHQIVRTGMTITQRGQAYIAGILKEIVVSRRRSGAQTTAQTSVDAAVTQANADAAAIA